MTHACRDYLLGQLTTAWALTEFHLNGLTTDECLWRPGRTGPQVYRDHLGRWHADWPEHEGYDLGPPSIAWLTWHIDFWWSMVLDHSFGSAALTRDSIDWPGSAEGVRERLTGLHRGWLAAIGPLSDADLRSQQRARWPMQDRPFGDVIAWVNIELMKNAAEIGYARFLYAVRSE
jgi:hypothetical protein